MRDILVTAIVFGALPFHFQAALDRHHAVVLARLHEPAPAGLGLCLRHAVRLHHRRRHHHGLRVLEREKGNDLDARDHPAADVRRLDVFHDLSLRFIPELAWKQWDKVWKSSSWFFSRP
jgi:hypothetical protein